MKEILKKLGFRKPDEMERHITLKAQRNGYVFLMIALMLWTWWESIKVYIYHTRINPLPCLLLGLGGIVSGFSSLIMTRSAVKDDEDSDETGPLFKIILWVCAITGVIATVGAALLVMGARV